MNISPLFGLALGLTVFVLSFGLSLAYLIHYGIGG